MKHLDRSRYDRERHQRKQNDRLVEVDDGDRVRLIVMITSSEASGCELHQATASDYRHRQRTDVAARSRSVGISLSRSKNIMGRKARMSCQDSRAINLFARDDDYGETAEWLSGRRKRTTSNPSHDVGRLRITEGIVFDHRNKTSLAQTRSNAADPRTKGRGRLIKGGFLIETRQAIKRERVEGAINNGRERGTCDLLHSLSLYHRVS
jgi:hypothetical protein